jgi:hypothetical protein
MFSKRATAIVCTGLLVLAVGCASSDQNDWTTQLTEQQIEGLQEYGGYTLNEDGLDDYEPAITADRAAKNAAASFSWLKDDQIGSVSLHRVTKAGTDFKDRPMWVVMLTGVNSPSFGETVELPTAAADADATGIMAVFVDPASGKMAKAISF